MKKVFLFSLFIFCFLLFVGTEQIWAVPVTHSLSGSLSQYTPVDPHGPNYIVDPQLVDLFEVTFDDSGTSFDGYSILADTEFTMDIETYRLQDPNAVFLSNASFTFSSELLSVFPLLGINCPDEGILQASYVIGLRDVDHSDDPLSYMYVYNFDHTAIAFYSEKMYYGSEDTTSDDFLMPGNGLIYDDLTWMDPVYEYDSYGNLTNYIPGYYDFGNNAYYVNVEYQVTSQAPVPEPATLLLLGSGLAGLVGFRRNIKKQ